MRWSPSDKMWTNQTAVVQPRLVPSQLPCGLKCLSSSSGMPIRLLWVNRIGISSTRSVVTFSCSAMQTAYRIFKMLSPFDRTMSLYELVILFDHNNKDAYTGKGKTL